MTTALLVCAFVLVAGTGLAVTATRDTRLLAVTLSVYGLALTLLFLLLAAPDVALSQVAVGSAVVPLLVLLTVRTVRRGKP
ncbi:hydrogenase subunit MbhD domain-containing protein [Sciscionella sediminilitoris]|uniref:hydrogenase subunit MbhD domain-containing protein n=1 Tax=Sciscionella sediminilitoris TaxID=1445613 RepID=UPI0004DF1BEE|nr:hydrogenase subunit MbhD domain-containing protein [Sciscionella sp. SE31]